MTALKVGSKGFVRRYQEKSEELLDIAQGLSSRPSPEEVHDLRVTARRIQVMRRLLPKRMRLSQASKRFDLVLKSVLKRTSHLRDLDTLTFTLEAHKASVPEVLLVVLRNERSDAAAQAKGACRLLAGSPPPDIGFSGFSGKKLSKRLLKRVRKHWRAVAELASEVVNDESKVEMLHSLRIEVKRLRYLLELADSKPPELGVASRWQESLGAVHDLDVAIEFLDKREEVEMKGWARDALKRSRHRAYLDFVSECRTDSVEILGDSGIFAWGQAMQVP